MRLHDLLINLPAEHPTAAPIALGTVAGLMAALGKAIHAGSFPDRRWWASRILVAGFFALTASYVAETAGITANGTAFLASLLNLMGFAAVEMIERRARQALEGATEGSDNEQVL